MQIHELTKQNLTEGLFDKLKTGVQTASKAIKTKGGSSWSELYRATESDNQTQAWIDGQLKRWKELESQLVKMPSQTTTTAQPTAVAQVTPTTDQPIIIGGQKLNPKNPKDAEIIKKVQAQQSLTEAVPPNLAQQFEQWSNKQLATTSRDGTSITMDMVKRDPESSSQVTQALNIVKQSLGTPQFDQAFKNYMNVATAGVRRLTQARNLESSIQDTPTSGNKQQRQPTATGVTQQAQSLISAMKLSQPQLDALMQYLNQEGARMVSTGSPSLDAVLKQIGKL